MSSAFLPSLGRETGSKSQRPGPIVLVGHPNVGKSLLFNALSDQYATVSNYPGTTVEILRGRTGFAHRHTEIIDTPGMYSLLPLSEEEKAARSLLLDSPPGLIIQVVDAKNLERSLPMTFQLLETGVPMMLVLNMMDEAKRLGIVMDTARLSERLAIPVVPSSLIHGQGVSRIRQLLQDGFPAGERHSFETDRFQPYLHEAARLFHGAPWGLPALLRLYFMGDEEILKRLENQEPSCAEELSRIHRRMLEELDRVPVLQNALDHAAEAQRLVREVVLRQAERPSRWRTLLDGLTMNPWTGIPLALIILYVGLYRWVGGFGAGTVVDFLEGLFESNVNPWVQRAVHVIPWVPLQELIAGDYGIITLGLRYALALILPIVTLFFMFFSLLEDTGYLPRLAMMLDRLFKKLGLSGRAVIPLVLGFGCSTMATVVTRTLPSLKERLIATFLLALAIPCSAQMGVILSLLHGRPAAMAVWACVVGVVFLTAGVLASKVLPGPAASFYLELPPLRRPKWSHLLTKTASRVHWYLLEVIPLFLLASVLIWLGQLSGVFDMLVRGLEGPSRWIGLPAETAKVFLFGFFRRDYGAAGLYDLDKQGLLNGVQLTVASVALTLFMPCVAQLLMKIKERGWRTALAMATFVICFSVGVSWTLNAVLVKLGITL